jgi:serine/threonine-protein kinase
VDKGETVTLEVSSGSAEVSVPDVIGLDEASARTKLEDAGFQVDVFDRTTTDPEQDGTVVDQQPVGGVLAKNESVVVITVARVG